MTRDLISAVLIGRSTIGGRTVDHLVLTSPGLELQLWLEPGTALPVAEAVVYVDHPRLPHFYVEYHDWRLAPRLPASTFALPRPAGARQVDLRDIEPRALGDAGQ